VPTSSSPMSRGITSYVSRDYGGQPPSDLNWLLLLYGPSCPSEIAPTAMSPPRTLSLRLLRVNRCNQPLLGPVEWGGQYEHRFTSQKPAGHAYGVLRGPLWACDGARRSEASRWQYLERTARNILKRLGLRGHD